MAETVVLTVQTGPHKGMRFRFRAPTDCLVGRAEDCFVRFSGANRDLMISRHHCQLHIDPPRVRVQDLGSRNGTYINGHTIRAAEAGQDAPIGDAQRGDIITIGGTSIAVDIADAAPDGASAQPEEKYVQTPC